MVAPLALPEPLLARFRAAAFERLERIDTTWTALTHGSGSSKGDEEMFRELHTLKGDARVVGFPDVALLCQRLEDLLSAARRRRYQVHEDVDVVVTMAIQFAGMLLRKKAGITRGIDLEGFLAQIEVVLAEWLRRTSAPPPPSVVGTHLRVEAPKVTAGACGRLSVVATTVYLEQFRASSLRSRERLRRAWESLLREIVELDGAPLSPVLTRHAAAAHDLARELGKSVEVLVEGANLWVDAEVVDALNTAVLHAIRNAVDHGIDSPAVRTSAGKPPGGTIRVRSRQREEMIEIDVVDDGEGVDFASVKRKAARLGLLTEDLIGAEDDGSLTELLFAPGFSTRDQVTEISGRGVGLDAVRAAVRRLGGQVRMESARGRGTSLRFAVPNRRAPVDVRVFRAPGAPVPFAIDTSWEVEPQVGGNVPVDPLALLDLPRSGSPFEGGALALRRADRRCVFASESVWRTASAARLCPTPADCGVEVVRLEEGEALLLKPEVLLDRTGSEVSDA